MESESQTTQGAKNKSQMEVGNLGMETGEIPVDDDEFQLEDDSEEEPVQEDDDDYADADQSERHNVADLGLNSDGYGAEMLTETADDHQYTSEEHGYTDDQFNQTSTDQHRLT